MVVLLLPSFIVLPAGKRAGDRTDDPEAIPQNDGAMRLPLIATRVDIVTALARGRLWARAKIGVMIFRAHSKKPAGVFRRALNFSRDGAATRAYTNGTKA